MVLHKNLIGNKLFLLPVELLKLIDALLLVDLVLVEKALYPFGLSSEPKRHLGDCISMSVVDGIVEEK